jgi:ribosome biogenesis GTPase
VSLYRLGATPEIFLHFESYAATGCMLGRVAVAIRDEYRVYTETGEFRAEASGALLFNALTRGDLPAVGDWVALRMVGDGEAIVQAVLPRRTRFSRRSAGTREDEQVMAANVDTALIVCGLDGDFNVRRLERYLTLVHEAGASGIVVLSKTDLCADLGGRIGEARAVARETPVVAISSIEDAGLGALEPHILPGRTLVLLGSSGAGKSTLLNRLIGFERQRTAGVRESDSRGRHTTTHRELIVLPGGGILIDTPGMRELQLWANEESLDQTFDDIAELARACRFRDCSHESERGCAVLAAIAAGSLDEARWESYRKLRREIHRHELLVDKTAAAAEKQKWKSIHKALRNHNKYR